MLLSLVVIFTQSIQLSKIVYSERLVAATRHSGALENMLKNQYPPYKWRLNLKQVCFDVLQREMVELTGIEPMTSCLQSRRSPN